MTGDKSELAFGVAAVTQFIDPDQIAKSIDMDPDLVTELLFPEIETSLDEKAQRRWTLRTSRRQQILASTTPDVARSWVKAAGSGRTTDLERVLRTWICGELDVEKTSRTARDEMQLAATWLRRARWVTPTPDSVALTIEIASLRARLEHACPAFIGRHADRDWLTHAISATQLAVIEASGGMGKSALLGRWLLDEGAYERVVAITLDFEDPTLNVLRLDNVFAEIGRQAALQVPEAGGYETELRAQAVEVRERRGEAIQSMERGFEDSRSISLMHGLMGTLRDCGRRTVVVLDTFERALRSPRELCDLLVSTLRQTMNTPTMGLLIAGRTPIQLPSLDGAFRRELGPLVHGDGEELLKTRKVPSEMIPRILERVPASPLTLRLAARCVDALGDRALDDEELDHAIARSQLDGYLHARILGHMSSPRLASVGRVALLMRSLTSERLLTIVGPLIEPPIDNAFEADQLIRELAKVSDLVSTFSSHDRIELRLEVFEEATRLIHSEDPQLARKLHERVAEVLDGSSEPADVDDREYHLRALAELERGGTVTGESRKLSLRDLRSMVPEMLRSGRQAEALQLVKMTRSAATDADILVSGSRAAKSLGLLDDCEQLARRAVTVAKASVQRAQAAVLLAWVADRRGEAEAARRERSSARDELTRVPIDEATAIARAEVLVALHVDSHDWVRLELARMFATPRERDALIRADIDLLRQVSSIVCSREMLSFAADVKAFEFVLPLNFDALAQALAKHDEVVSSLRLRADDLAGALAQVQRERSLGTAVGYMLLQAGDDPALCEALAGLLDQMRTDPVMRAHVDSKARAQSIAKLADRLYAKSNEGYIFQAKGLAKATSKAQAHSSLLQIDRMRLGNALVKELDEHGLADEALMAASLFSGDNDKES